MPVRVSSLPVAKANICLTSIALPGQPQPGRWPVSRPDQSERGLLKVFGVVPSEAALLSCFRSLGPGTSQP
jgi:hypothetical protein